ncbi:hypothetical protein SAMN02799630_03909 [Paenibacillus sp. UNCCL117]|uniref:hypothetical protein n=1 Tax=unclassified Paenibacillus TaxID=185978 RepID=UPI00088DA2EE|nr:MULTISPECIES: hypothetical protein [unclassified Paenibacillus]SDD55914.1 hypothetical protein SAMN04488602_11026 [Paenibacillus sp. cl123]SFW51491.1 hypothetical protein SAMN02799630_03909 [Paenibacillus sp. UNCCL117]
MYLRQGTVICLIVLLLLSHAVSPAPARADSGTDTGAGEIRSLPDAAAEARLHSPAIWGKAAIGNESYMELKEVMLLPGDHTGTLAFTLTVYNGGENDLAFDDYWVRLQTAAGTPISVTLLPRDKNKNRVAPGSSENFGFYAKVAASLKLEDLVFKLIRLDFAAAGFEQVVGRMTAPEDDEGVTPAGEKRSLSIGGVPFHGIITHAAISQNDEFYLPALDLELMNAGINPLHLPNLSFFIRTPGGLYYPLQSADFIQDAAVQPMEKKAGMLTVSIPKEAGADGWQLVITEPIAGGAAGERISLPAAFLEVPEATLRTVSIGNDYDFTNKQGTYTARLNSLQRLPWEDQDILSAGITLINNGTQALPVPELQGYFKLDDAVSVEARVVRSDQVISLLPGKEMNIQLAGKIPFTSEFRSLNLYLQEKEAANANKAKDLLVFQHNEALMDMAFIPPTDTRRLTDIGQSAAYRVHAVHTFEGQAADLIAVQLEVENLEKRFAGLRKQVAQFQSADGTILPATVTAGMNKVNPGGKALQTIWAMVPKGYRTEGMRLLLGDELSVPAARPEEGVVRDGYINAAAFGLPAEKKEVQAGFAGLEVYPYTISLSRIGTQANFATGTVLLDFDYELKRSALVEADMKEHKLIVELTDELVDSGKEIVVSQTYDLAGKEASKSLLLGRHDARISYADKDTIYKIKDMKTYRLNVYHQFQDGQKKLLASKELDWFAYSD